MEQPRAQSVLAPPPFQARASQFFKRFHIRTRVGTKKSKESMVPVPIDGVFGRQRGRSMDMLSKPDMSHPLVGFPMEDTSNTDDSSQDASSRNTPRQSRRFSAWDHLVDAPVSPIFAARGPAPMFLRERSATESAVHTGDSDNVLAPPLVFLRSTGEHAPTGRADLPTSTPSILVSEALPQTLQSNRADSDSAGDAETTPRPTQSSSPLLDELHVPNSPESIPLPTDSSDDLSQSIPSIQLTLQTGIQGRRSPAPPLTTPLPPPFRISTERGLRLSPSIITRQPMPILNLPILPPPTPVVQPDSRPQVRLRSMPSLSVHGRSNADRESDHDNSGLGDSDEEDDIDEGEGGEGEAPDDLGEAQSDEDADETLPDKPPAGPSMSGSGLVTSPTPTAGPSRAGLPPSNEPPPVQGNVADYFSSKIYNNFVQQTPGRTPQPYAQQPFSPQFFSPKTPHAELLNARLPPRVANVPSPDVRPGTLHRTASRSMIDLNASRKGTRDLTRMRTRDTVRSNVPSIAGRTSISSQNQAESVESDDTTDAMIGRLMRRQTSMPTFHPSTDPPPYPSFGPRAGKEKADDQPREGEGNERLPEYSNSLYLTAIMPCKMEFSAPGVQAKDRKWRRLLCELEGTCFRVYKCPPGASGAGIIGEWWEKKVGVGDVTTGHYAPMKKDGDMERPSKLALEAALSSTRPPSLGEQRRRSESQSSTLSSVPSSRAKRASGASFLSPWRAGGSSSRPQSRGSELEPVAEPSRSSFVALTTTSSRTETSGRNTPVPQARSSSRMSFLPTPRAVWRSGETPKPASRDLIRSYTLQNAESGLGNDYLKRKNVIRVRLEGEQFLLQAHDVPAVVEWIEGFHAGTNIALDLDHRVMPKGPMFPRRRRRRARRTQTGEGTRPASSRAPGSST
ncbi:hypothetical protein BV22DRAFT_1119747 [Leucogyrophana mollusca]|uniref:Uncharacterized protein n=1 Tax=Leucogyrophana mollusca TaxID=85980 RepID=A0ACB8BGU3_9AGAM|nr:hypothetical protein BV22DRAFT_1119747 [Leucogyrophana mollusca]